MRDLETCKAEVFRRSEEKIKERSRMRRRALTLCVPLVLCLVIGAVTAPMLLRDGNKAGPSSVADSLPESQSLNKDAADPYGAAPRIESDAASKLLRSLAPSADTAIAGNDNHDKKNTGKDPDTAYETVDGTGIPYSGYAEDALRFTLVTPEGEETYTLCDGMLRCETECWQRELTEEEEETLRRTLGLSPDDSR